MNYLAFDIEAANGFNPASICSVGVVAADENFNILKKENLWINPKSKYNLNGTRPNVGIDLHLDKIVLENSPDFKDRYREIKSLLTAKDTVVVGHAVDSDVRMLNAACGKYKLPCINFKFVCSQLLYKCYKNDKNVMGLDKIADELGLSFKQHFSDEDALVSLLTLKFLCEKTNLEVRALMEKFNLRWGENKNFEITRPAALSGQVSKKKITQVAVEKIKREIAHLKKRAQIGDSLKGKVFALSRDLEIADKTKWLPIIKKIVCGGGEYTAKIGNGNVYITNGNVCESSKMRERYLRMRVEKGEAVEIIEAEDFLSRNYGGSNE